MAEARQKAAEETAALAKERAEEELVMGGTLPHRLHFILPSVRTLSLSGNELSGRWDPWFDAEIGDNGSLNGSLNGSIYSLDEGFGFPPSSDPFTNLAARASPRIAPTGLPPPRPPVRTHHQHHLYPLTEYDPVMYSHAILHPNTHPALAYVPRFQIVVGREDRKSVQQQFLCCWT